MPGKLRNKKTIATNQKSANKKSKLKATLIFDINSATITERVPEDADQECYKISLIKSRESSRIYGKMTDGSTGQFTIPY